MIINGKLLLREAPIKAIAETKQSSGGVTWGLSEAGYDIRIKQMVKFSNDTGVHKQCVNIVEDHSGMKIALGRFVLASAIEEFDMPVGLVGVVHDKSSWARQGLSVFNTVIEPGWKGFLTLELVYHGNDTLIIPAGSGIAQVLFHSTSCDAQYSGRYQHQSDRPVEAIQAE